MYAHVIGGLILLAEEARFIFSLSSRLWPVRIGNKRA